MTIKELVRSWPGARRISGMLHRTSQLRQFKANYRAFCSLSAGENPRFSIHWSDRFPQLSDKTVETGFDRHYIYHPAWAARVLARTRPAVHIDISSSLSFSTIVSAFVPVHFYDYRPAKLQLGNLTSAAGDLTALCFPSDSVESLSCMHTVEHVGLGRYGDTMDPTGDLKAIAELTRVVRPGGALLFVTPVGRPKIMFNAHRIYAHEQILTYFSKFKLREFALVPDNEADGGLIIGATPEQAGAQSYGCGCYWFQKQ